jgi:hypothetical protein
MNKNTYTVAKPKQVLQFSVHIAIKYKKVIEYKLPHRPITGTMYKARKRRYDVEMNASEASRFLCITRWTLCNWMKGKYLKIGPYKQPALIPPHEIRRLVRKNKGGKYTEIVLYKYQLLEWVHRYRVHVLVKRRRNEMRVGKSFYGQSKKAYENGCPALY